MRRTLEDVFVQCLMVCTRRSHTQVKRENVTSKEKKLLMGVRCMYVWIGMYAGSVPMFLFVVIPASVACEIKRKKKEEEIRPFLFSYSLIGLVIDITRIRIGLLIIKISILKFLTKKNSRSL